MATHGYDDALMAKNMPRKTSCGAGKTWGINNLDTDAEND
jgi:hypothetical protein